MEREPLERFQEAVGAGKIRDIPGTGKAAGRTVFSWTVHGLGNVQYVLGQIWPYMSSVKRQQSLGAVRFWVSVPRRYFATSKITAAH